MAFGNAVRAGRAFIELTVDDQTRKDLQSWSKSVAGVAVVAAAFEAARRAVLDFAATGDAIGKMSQRVRIGAEQLQELGFAADRSGVSLDSLAQAVFRANRRIANATSGTGPAVRAIEELGIAAEDLNRLAPEQQLATLADALNDLDDESRANQLGFEIFGDNFRQILPLIQEGSSGIESLRRRARDLGLVLSEEAVAGAVDLTDAITDLSSALKGLSLEFGNVLNSLGIAEGLRGTADIIAFSAEYSGG